MTTQTPNQHPSQPRTRTIHRNEPFTCKKCKEANPQAKIGCRNHCRNCLYSQHVDENVPGDRVSACLGLMEPLDIDQHPKKGFKIMQRCLKCHKIMWNKVAEDDDLAMVTQLIKLHNERTKKRARREKSEKSR